jgi:Uma2 family endonuclease
MSIATPLMTAEQFLALPEDGMERELIRGELKERPMTVRNQYHAEVMAIVSQRLRNWLESLPAASGKVYAGDVGCILQRDPDLVVGIDVAYFSEHALSQASSATTLLEGAPVLAVEILSPSDTQENIVEKVDNYLSAGTALVWLIDPHFRTVTVYRADRTIETFDHTRTLTVEPHLPGFAVAVPKLFG